MGGLKNFQSLKNSKEFSVFYKKGIKINTKTTIIYYISKKIHKIGFTASKKVGIAVARNRAKRLLRAVFLQNIPKLISNEDSLGSFVFVAKKNLNECGFEQIQKDMYWALHKLNAINKA